MNQPQGKLGGANRTKPGGAAKYPGQQLGMTVQGMRDFTRAQKRVRGFEFQLAIGANDLDINLSGSANFLLGFSIIPDPNNLRTVTGRFEVNSEIVIQETLVDFFSSEFTDEEYYFFPRPLSGQDSLTFFAQSTAAQNIFLAFYYI